MRAPSLLLCGLPDDWITYLQRYFRDSAVRIKTLPGTATHELLARQVSQHYALVLAEAGLDTGLAHELRALRHEDHLVLLIGVQRTRKPDEEARLIEAGVDDMVDHPAGPEVLGARLRLRIRLRGWACEPSQFTRFGEVQVDIENGHIYKPDGSQQRLRRSDAEVLRCRRARYNPFSVDTISPAVTRGVFGSC